MEKSKVTGYNILQKFVRKEISRITGLEPEQLKRKEGESIEDFRTRLEKARNKHANETKGQEAKDAGPKQGTDEHTAVAK